MKKAPMNLYFSIDTRARLRQYAENHHTTVSQAITDWIWEQEVVSFTDLEENPNFKVANENENNKNSK